MATVSSIQGDSAPKIVNQRFLDQIRRLDTYFTPLKPGLSPNPYEKKTKPESFTIPTPQNQVVRSKYDKDFDFKSMNDMRKLPIEFEGQMPSSITDIISMKKRVLEVSETQSPNPLREQIGDGNEQGMDDMIELGGFDKYFQKMSYSNVQTENVQIDLSDLKIDQILQIVSGVVSSQYLKEISLKHESYLNYQNKSTQI